MDNEVNPIQDINRPKLQGNVNIQETKSNTFTNFSDGKNNNNSRGMVEELTLKDFNKGKLELVGASKPNIWEDSDSISFSEFLEKNQEIQKNQNETTENETQQPSPGIRTKILSKSGFSEFFVKNTLKGKGVIFRGPPRDGVGAHEAKPSVSPKNESLNMREWLNKGGNKRDKSRNVYVFKKILDLVDSSHSQGVALQSLKPSCFKLLPSNHVLYLGSLENGDGVLRKRKVGDNRNSFGMWPNRSHDVKLGLSSFNGDLLEEQWYSSHEDVKERRSTLSSNIYSLGVLLFELLGSFESAREHVVAMMNLGQRILPPRFLSENPKEAGYCLWMLHPEAPARPTTRDILKSNLVSGLEETSTDDLISSISQEETESEILSHFLASLKEQKQKHATKLVQNIHCLESDITEVESRRESNSFPKSIFGESRLKTNLSHLESAYFSVRSSIEIDSTDTVDRESNKPLDRLGMFFNGLCKYARYSKFEVRGNLRGGDFSSSANVICSLGFDRDEDYFATAGVSKKIKVYDFSLLLDDSVDIHYPAVEMSNKSKLSCICWNTYIKNYLASTDYDGVVKIWDAGSGQAVSHHVEHERRAWSVDFSRVDPTKFVSGSDDCFVKLWSINEKKSLSTIKNIANVCCVQFSPYSPHLLSFGSADYRTYCYDVRNISTPLCILAGHDRAVSYVKFLDSETLVSASTDNTLKLWDLNKTNDCILTFKGHTNEKNFVGLCVADGYIACGSETNEVFAYHRSLPMPITAHKFGSIDPVSGKETDHGNNQFVSSVCWRQKSDMVIAANSSGCLKLLQMV